MEQRPAHRLIRLADDWDLQSSARCGRDGAALSAPAVDLRGWYRTRLPATVVGTLVDAGALGDPFTGAGFDALPDRGPHAENFANHAMPEGSPFAVPWWFRRELTVPADAPEHLSLQLDGVNYRANVWLNGTLLAGAADLAGSYREHELPLRGLHRDRPNVLAIEVAPPQPCDLALSWVDWNPWPPDKNTGLWRDVWLRGSGAVALRAPHVLSHLDGHDALLTVAADLVNRTDRPQRALLRVDVAGAELTAQVTLGPGEQRRVELGADGYPELRLRSPRLWWPRFMGEPELHDVAIAVDVDGRESDSARFRFGIREVTSQLTADGHALFRVNGEPVLIRGAGWASDLFLRRDPARDLAQLEYAQAMNLNAIRFEGMLERHEILDWCDAHGMMVIAGWCCCDCWEKWDQWGGDTERIAAESLRSQIRRVRRHPSLISWWYGSDFPPPAHVERRYLQVLAEEHWPNPTHSSASHRPTELTGSSGLKMLGPYDYVPPGYWLEDQARGGAFGFATEICPGPAVPPIESLRRMLGEDHLWPIDEVWRLHCGGKEFHNLDAFTDALLARYGDVHNAEQFAELAQLMTYESQRAMFEAYARNRWRSTGVIQWMLNNAWPSLIWHLFDHHLRPGGGYFGTRAACAPVHVMYAYDDRSVVVINDHRVALAGVQVRARAVDLAGRELHSASVVVDVPARGTLAAFTLPPLEVRAAYLLVLELDGGGRRLDRNVYWLPPRADELDHAAATWIHTPIRRYADLSALRALPAAQPTLDSRWRGGELEVELIAPADRLAFFVQLRAIDDDGDDILPVLWTDNYLTLLAGERQTVHATFSKPPGRVRVEARGINVASLVVSPDSVQNRIRASAAQPPARSPDRSPPSSAG